MTYDSVEKPPMMSAPSPLHACVSHPTRPVLTVRLGLLLFIGAAGGFFVIAAGVAACGPSDLLPDQAVAIWFRTQRTPTLLTAMHLATSLGSTSWVTGVALCAALALMWRRCWDRLLMFGMAVPGGMVLCVILKTVFHRARSGPETWSSSFLGYGFPSGHTMAATLLYGALAACVFDAIANRCVRAGAVFGAVALVGLVGFSRLALGAHYLSEVVAAVAAGLAWLVLCFTTTDALRRRISAQGHP